MIKLKLVVCWSIVMFVFVFICVNCDLFCACVAICQCAVELLR